jgi:GT2 family glycosyltransferase
VSTAARPDLSVVIVTHGGREMALRTLRSGLASSGPIESEWIVVDSGSTDGTPDAIEAEFGSEVTVIRAPNRGFAAGNNVGIARARGRYVLLLNPDVEVLRGTFAELLEALDARPEVGIASVVQRGSDGTLQFSMRRFPSVARDLGESLFASRRPFLRSLQEIDDEPRHYEVEASPDWACGAFLCARAETVAQVGPMDERFFLYSEEIDWCLRARKAGWDVRHLPTMEVTHHAGRRDRGDLMAQLAYSRSLFARKHHDRFGALGIRAALALGAVLRITAKLPLTPFSAAARERTGAEAKALRVLLGLAGPPLAAEPLAAPAPTEPAAAGVGS